MAERVSISGSLAGACLVEEAFRYLFLSLKSRCALGGRVFSSSPFSRLEGALVTVKRRTTMRSLILWIGKGS